MVRRTALLVVVAALGAALWAPGTGRHRVDGASDLPQFPSAGLAGQLRYVGRDGATGLPNAVSDRYIAEVQRSFETYYVEDGEPLPPPPAAGPGVSMLALPSLGLAAPVARLGLDRAGRLDVPQDAVTVGWNPGFTSLPGTGQASFFAAHYEYAGTPGVFFRLSDLRSGDEVVVTRSDGVPVRYVVRSAVDYALEAIDMGAILGGLEGRESLALMTCSGPGDGGRYPLRTLVLAERVP
ncbi:MAG: class F sortase [Dehalococcoidia bacterium]